MNQLRPLLNRFRRWFGYVLFLVSITYGLYHAPGAIWQIELFWFLVTFVIILLMFIVEMLQFFFFFRHHRIKPDLGFSALFTTRKGVLNTLLPAKAGVLLVLHMIIEHYGLKWHEYVRFMLVASVLALLVSGLAFSFILFDLYIALLLSLLSFLVSFSLSRYFKASYFRQAPWLLSIAIGLYLVRLAMFWTLLRGLGYDLSWAAASYFAIAMNTLGQIAITPGNIGIREVVLGAIAPYLEVPVPVGILVGTIFQMLRLIIYAGILFLLERILPQKFRRVEPAPDATSFD